MSVQAIGSSAQQVQSAQAQEVQQPSYQQVRTDIEPRGGGETKSISEEAIKEQIDNLNKILTDKNTNISLEYDNLNSPEAINIVDETSGKIIRSIPPESAIEIANKARDYVVGLIVDEYA